MNDIRIIDSQYRDLFAMQDGENLLLNYMDGTSAMRPVKFIDDYHFFLGVAVFHICQFSEHCEEEGIVAAPEIPQQRPSYGTYEIYQLPDPRSTNYAFVGYEAAKEAMRPEDYKLVYRGMMPQGETLDDLFDRHNRDDRPFGQKMRSMSVSDIVVTHYGDKTEVCYCDSFRFAKMPPEWDVKLRLSDGAYDQSKAKLLTKEMMKPVLKHSERSDR